MRKLWLAAPVLLLAGCGGNPDVPPTVSWQLGAGSADQYPGPKPTYSWAGGQGTDLATSSAQAAKPQYSFGPNGASMVIPGSPSAPQQVAAPAPTPAAPRTGSSGTHS